MVKIIRIEIDLFNKKKIRQLEAKNLIMKQQLANYRNELLEWNRAKYKDKIDRLNAAYEERKAKENCLEVRNESRSIAKANSK